MITKPIGPNKVNAAAFRIVKAISTKFIDLAACAIGLTNATNLSTNLVIASPIELAFLNTELSNNSLILSFALSIYGDSAFNGLIIF